MLGRAPGSMQARRCRYALASTLVARTRGRLPGAGSPSGFRCRVAKLLQAVVRSTGRGSPVVDGSSRPTML